MKNKFLHVESSLITRFTLYFAEIKSIVVKTDANT